MHAISRGGFISPSKFNSGLSLRGGLKADEAIFEGKSRLLRFLRSLAMTNKGLTATYETASKTFFKTKYLLLLNRTIRVLPHRNPSKFPNRKLRVLL